MRRPLLGAVLVVLAVLAPATRTSTARTAVMPSVVLWAWERPTDLRAINATSGVAFLAQTITIEPTRFVVESRRWPLYVPPSAALTAVTRIEMPTTRAVSTADVDRVVTAIVTTASYSQVASVQIDFDATLSQRSLYRDVITLVRRGLDRRVTLSMTALASWCVGDRWLDGLPVDEAVPMLFQLGPLNEPYRHVAVDAKSAHPLCRSSIGISLGEPIPLAAEGRRVYVFNPGPWTPFTIERAQAYARRLRRSS